MLLKNGKVKLMDFGAARDYTDFGEKSLSIVLKPGYASEEQYRSRGIQGPWTDIYALSATIYKCITGITPEESMQRVIEDSLVNSDYAEKSSQAVGADTSNAQTDSSEASEATTEAAAATATQLSDKLEDYIFMLEGDVYQLPFAYSVLADKGWRIYDSGYYDDTKINGNSYDDITLQKDKKTINVYIINASGNSSDITVF